MNDLAFLDTAAVDGGQLLEAAKSDWSRHVPHCPHWNAAALVAHTGTILAWMAAIITTGERVSRRELDSPPADHSELGRWYRTNLDRTVALMGESDPSYTVWTFSSLGDQRVQWWHRRLAVEVAIHRWDAEHAGMLHGGSRPAPLNAHTATAGIEEFVTEFLPGLLTRDLDERPSGVLHLHTVDDGVDVWLDLDQRGEPTHERRTADTSIAGTPSDVLLWLTNREPAGLDVGGDERTLTRWKQLCR